MASGPLPPPPGHRDHDMTAAPGADGRPRQRVPDRGEPWPLPPAPGSPAARGGGSFGSPPPQAPGGPGWSSPQASQPPGAARWGGEPSKRTDGVAVTALVLGVLGLVASLIPLGLVVGVPLGIAAIVTGIIGIRRRIQRGLAIGGLVTGVLSLVVAAAYVALFSFVVESSPGVLEGVVEDAIERAAAVSASSSCDDGEAEPVEPTVVEAPPDVVVHTIEACPDFADDIEWAVELENTGSEPVDLQLSATPVQDDQPTGDTSTAPATLEAGERGWVDITTLDQWRTPLNIDLQITEG